MTSDFMEMYSIFSKPRKSLCAITDNQLIADILTGEKHKYKAHKMIYENIPRPYNSLCRLKCLKCTLH